VRLASSSTHRSRRDARRRAGLWPRATPDLRRHGRRARLRRSNVKQFLQRLLLVPTMAQEDYCSCNRNVPPRWRRRCASCLAKEAMREVRARVGKPFPLVDIRAKLAAERAERRLHDHAEDALVYGLGPENAVAVDPLPGETFPQWLARTRGRNP
jgi:hypothetical protein